MPALQMTFFYPLQTVPIDYIAAEFATATDDEFVGGSPRFSSVQGQESSGFSSGDSVEQPTR